MAQQFSGLPMDSLIGGPLNAAAKANAAMAMTQTRFMLDTCFSKAEGSDNYTPIMIKMELTRGVIQPTAVTKPETGEANPPEMTSVTTTFNLPLLTIIPLNALAVETVDITFEMEVKSSFAEETNHATEKAISASASFEAKVGYGPFSASVSGSASYDSKESSSQNTQYSKSNSAKYSVAVHAGQLPLPKGVNTIIEAYAGAIQPIELPAQKPADEKKTS
jgi:hypothetical protein